jgi:hypothetical protein
MVMSKPLFRMSAVAASAAIALAAETPALAQNDAQAANLRGNVVSYSGSALMVKSREGAIVDVELAEGWKITSLTHASLASIKPGDYVGIASLPKADRERVLEVLISPPALKGLGEGSHGWDLKPHSNMTNASVSNLVKGINGQTVTLSYNGDQQKTITIPPTAPLVTFAPATPDDLKPGAAVLVPIAGGTRVTAHQVVMGKDGVVPPM